MFGAFITALVAAGLSIILAPEEPEKVPEVEPEKKKPAGKKPTGEAVKATTGEAEKPPAAA